VSAEILLSALLVGAVVGGLAFWATLVTFRDRKEAAEAQRRMEVAEAQASDRLARIRELEQAEKNLWRALLLFGRDEEPTEALFPPAGVANGRPQLSQRIVPPPPTPPEEPLRPKRWWAALVTRRLTLLAARESASAQAHPSGRPPAQTQPPPLTAAPDKRLAR
jgi:hypothetical protein